MFQKQLIAGLATLLFVTAGEAASAPRIAKEVRAGSHIAHRGMFADKQNLPSQGRAALRSVTGHMSPYASSRAGLVNVADGLSINSYFRRSKSAIALEPAPGSSSAESPPE